MGFTASGEDLESEDDATQAFLILAFLAYLVSFILVLATNFADVTHKIVTIITIIACFFGGTSHLATSH